MQTVHSLQQSLPAGSQLPLAFSGADFTDAYSIELPPDAPTDASTLTHALLGQAPGWVRQLMRLRDTLVRPLGLYTFPGGQQPPAVLAVLEPGMRFGPFRVFDVRPGEVLLGENDKHLDFRVSVFVQPGAAGTEAVVSTAVRYNNRFGRLYFALVRPFHQLVVPAMLRHGRRQLAAAAPAR
ncbi:DUF2867 domain-containing protein [Hymenobacter koreensis]|uniref:DUF2867 domain-containing protein n=1 Tax=Hymenobacter koreensis TaxID=1084523 RepID=A0ABP8J437_9BACT